MRTKDKLERIKRYIQIEREDVDAEFAKLKVHKGNKNTIDFQRAEAYNAGELRIIRAIEHILKS